MAAPGVHIWTAAANGKANYVSGTSYAAPYVTAIAATLFRTTGNRTTARVMQEAIQVAPLDAAAWSPVFGYGLAQAPRHCSDIRMAEKLPWQSTGQPTQEASVGASFVPASFANQP